MELRHLRYFVAVAEELNFSRAAERLHVSQPPLSRQIRDLEAELKVTLLERDRQSVRLTRAGREVLTHARKLLRDAEALLNDASRMDKEKHEDLQIGYAPSLAAGIISRVLARYRRLSPGARITLHDMYDTEILAGLRNRKLDAALTLRPPASTMLGLKFEPVRRYPLGIICSWENPLAKETSVRPSSVRRSDLVTYRAKEFPEYFQRISKVLGVKQSELRINAECDDALGIVAVVESGRGIAVTGQFITAIAGKRVCFVPFAGGANFLEVGLLYRQGTPNERINQLLQAISNDSASFCSR
ncbi:MAG: LysR family transcriptional regulator [Verrucomicrobia bacterium]|nr:LysR family transcriptional regulator [Verrucomicrobiota bacterium]